MKNTNESLDLCDVRLRFRELRDGLAATYREREGAIECITLAALSGNHALLVGPPGTAKSALFTSFLASFVNARQFVTLLTKFGTEDELFGPVKLSALKNDQWERNLDGRLAGVECAFLDEVFKASDSILNAILSALNERLYKGQPIPLRMLVGASNELPDGENLAAIYDRFLLRDVVGYIDSDATWMSLVSTPPAYKPSVTISVAEWDAARIDVDLVPMPEKIVLELLRIKNELKANGLIVSDRRWVALTRVLRAAAWLDDCAEVEMDHLAVLRYGLWQKTEDRARVIAVLDTVDRSAVGKAVGIIDGALRSYAHRPTGPAYMEALPKLAAEVTDAAKRVQAELQAGVSKRARLRIAPKLEELRVVHDELKKDLSARYAL